jgi:DNA polymerase-3 subunit epsilon
MTELLRRLAFVDLETTGATATADRITEIGIVEVDDDGVREWSSLVNPGMRIGDFVVRLTGIDNEMVAAAPTFAELVPEVRARLADRLFIAHNARFDYGFLQNEFKRLGIDFHARVLCTVKLSRKLYPQFHKHSLDSLIERHGLRGDGRHRALADARLIWQFWQRVHDEHESEVINAAVAALAARPALPAHLDASLVDRLPEGHGVYLFFAEDDLPIYVGKSKNIRTRVLAHFAADQESARAMALAQRVQRIDWIETEGELGTLIKEAELVKRLQPTESRRLRTSEEFCSWRLAEEEPGLWRPQLVTAESADFGTDSGLYGLFKNAREAGKVLAAVADEHKLCKAILGLEQRPDGQPCLAFGSRKCKGVCAGKETNTMHSARLLAALARLRIQVWPYGGPALLREGGVAYVVDRWRYLGEARHEDEIWPLLDARLPAFDPDFYKILVKIAGRLTPLPSRG